MEVYYTHPDTCIGYNVRNTLKPFYLLRDFVVIMYGEFGRIRFIVPKGFTWDGCTIKLKLAKLFLGCEHTPEYVIASCLHDYILDHKEIIGYHREISSDMLETVLKREGVSTARARIMRDFTDLYQKYIRKW